MFASDQYELVDFGDGEKFERFFGTPVVRMTTAAMGNKTRPQEWPNDCLRFSKAANREQWIQSIEPPQPWLIHHRDICLELKPTPFGHLGVFAEQADNWDWLQDMPEDFSGLNALNLFAYTGATTLTLAAKGADVTHVDSAKTIVNWARSNAQHAGLESAPIRWIVEDVKKYVARELKRGRRYDIIVADPPSFGRGTKNETWKLEHDLSGLLAALALLCRKRCSIILVSCHTPEFDSTRLARMVRQQFDLSNGTGQSCDMFLTCREGRRLPSGSCFRWYAH